MGFNISTPRVTETITKHCLLVNQIKNHFVVKKNCSKSYEEILVINSMFPQTKNNWSR